MDENKHCTESNNCRPAKCSCSAMPFFLGAVLMLAFGWWIFPGLMFKTDPQPFAFSHITHVETAGLGCDSCHRFSETGVFSGTPVLADCTSCHSDLDSLMTPEPEDAKTHNAREAEILFIKNYVLTDQEVPWKVHQRQPDNVYFSHSAHFHKCFHCHATMKGALHLGSANDPRELCEHCHMPLEELDRLTGPQINILTGYGKTTRKMTYCEECHAFPGHYYDDGKGRTNANNACFTCHK